MSTGLNCVIREIAPATWYYLLEEGSAPKNAWDWREYAVAYGPFQTEHAACHHLHTHHANPGGYDIQNYQSGDTLDPVWTAHIAKAPAIMRQFQPPAFRLRDWYR